MNDAHPSDIQTAIDAHFPTLRRDLDALVRIPSISADGFDPANVRRSADLTATLLEQAGLTNLTLLETDGAHPAVYGERLTDPANPTVLLYAHHDVQPPGDEAAWTTPPFEPTERDGRLYGRGASDDKAGIAVHLAALHSLDEALDSDLPLNIKLFVEGEEEIGSLHLTDFLTQHAPRLRADAIVIADAANWRVGRPALTTSLRGLVDCVIELRTLQQGVHSGLFGGALPDAISALARLLATLHHDDGRVAVDGLTSASAEPLDLTEPELLHQAEALDGLHLIGRGSLTSRLWTQPALSILALETPPIDQAINQLVPLARAKISLRLAPGDDPARAMTALTDHLNNHIPWGADLTIIPGAQAAPFTLNTTGPAYDAFRAGLAAAWGQPPLEIGLGGSIPFVAAFAATYPDADILLTGVGEPTSRIHGPNESQDLDELRRGCLAEALALNQLALQQLARP